MRGIKFEIRLFAVVRLNGSNIILDICQDRGFKIGATPNAEAKTGNRISLAFTVVGGISVISTTIYPTVNIRCFLFLNMAFDNIMLERSRR